MYLTVFLSLCVMDCPGVFRLRTTCDGSKMDADISTPLIEMAQPYKNGKKNVYTFTYVKHIFYLNNLY